MAARGSDRFNRACFWASLLWLCVSVPAGIELRPTMPDFGQFYLSGILVSRGEWGALYPVPSPLSASNAGLNGDSIPKPVWRDTAIERGVVDWTHFILPPPSALLFVPFSALSYSQAYWVWIWISAACIWGVALIAALLLREVAGSATGWEGLLALLIVFSPVSARAIRIANVSPMIALAVGDRKSTRLNS